MIPRATIATPVATMMLSIETTSASGPKTIIATGIANDPIIVNTDMTRPRNSGATRS